MKPKYKQIYSDSLKISDKNSKTFFEDNQFNPGDYIHYSQSMYPGTVIEMAFENGYLLQVDRQGIPDRHQTKDKYKRRIKVVMKYGR